MVGIHVQSECMHWVTNIDIEWLNATELWSPSASKAWSDRGCSVGRILSCNFCMFACFLHFAAFFVAGSQTEINNTCLGWAWALNIVGASIAGISFKFWWLFTARVCKGFNQVFHSVFNDIISINYIWFHNMVPWSLPIDGGGEVGKCKLHFAALRVTSINLHYVNKCNLHFLTFLDIFDITPPKSRRGLKNVTYIVSTNVTYICWRHANCVFFSKWKLAWVFPIHNKRKIQRNSEVKLPTYRLETSNINIKNTQNNKNNNRNQRNHNQATINTNTTHRSQRRSW